MDYIKQRNTKLLFDYFVGNFRRTTHALDVMKIAFASTLKRQIELHGATEQLRNQDLRIETVFTKLVSLKIVFSREYALVFTPLLSVSNVFGLLFVYRSAIEKPLN